MKSNAIVMYVDGNFSIVENSSDNNCDIKFLKKYLHIPEDHIESCLYDVTDRFNDNFFIIRNTSYLGEYKIKNDKVSNIVNKDIYWHCAVMKAVDPNKPFYDLEFDHMSEEDIAYILNLNNKST